MTEIKEKVIVIMGASSGIGEATAVKLAEQGAKVVIAARREERIKALAEKLGENVLYQTADVTNREQVQQVIDLAMTSFGRIDVLFNNAGIMPQGNLAELNYDSWQKNAGYQYHGGIKRDRRCAAHHAKTARRFDHRH